LLLARVRVSSPHCAELGVRSLLPDGHAHVPVQIAGHAELALRTTEVPGALIEHAETSVAVGDDGTHAERVGQCQRITVVSFGRGEVC
jgi:hypothetical protein